MENNNLFSSMGIEYNAGLFKQPQNRKIYTDTQLLKIKRLPYKNLASQHNMDILE